MTIATFKKNNIECSICRQGSNEGKYFPKNVIYFTISKKLYESSQKSANIRIGKIFWNPQWKVYQEWEEAKVENLDEEDKDKFFALFCSNCFCEKCEKITIYSESYDEGRQTSYCERRCLPPYYYWPETDDDEDEEEKECSICRKLKITVWDKRNKRSLCGDCLKKVIKKLDKLTNNKPPECESCQKKGQELAVYKEKWVCKACVEKEVYGKNLYNI